MIILDEPINLLFLIIIPAHWFLRNKVFIRGGRIAVPFSHFGGNGFKTDASFFQYLVYFARFCSIASVLFLVLALTQPVKLGQKKVWLNEGKQLIFLVDVSPSMAAQDSPGVSRLTLVKSTIKEFVQRRSNDIVGLVAFGSDAALYCPPTRDYEAFLASLSSLYPLSLGDGSSLGLGLSVAALYFSRDRSQEKVLVLLSDGDNNAGEILPSQGSDLLKSLGVVVHVVGIGNNRDVYLELEDPTSGLSYRGTYQSILNEKLLMSIADAGSGRYFAAPGGKALSEAFDTIDSLELSDPQIRHEVQKEPLHPIMLIIALILFLLEQIIRRWFLREIS